MKTTALDRAGTGEDFGPHPVARDFAGIAGLKRPGFQRKDAETQSGRDRF
jgi:hypothetical protein